MHYSISHSLYRDYREEPKDCENSQRRILNGTGEKQDEDFNIIKKLMTEEPCLAYYAQGRETIVKIDASKTRLGITLWQKQSDGEIKPIALGSR